MRKIDAGRTSQHMIVGSTDKIPPRLQTIVAIAEAEEICYRWVVADDMRRILSRYKVGMNKDAFEVWKSEGSKIAYRKEGLVRAISEDSGKILTSKHQVLVVAAAKRLVLEAVTTLQFQLGSSGAKILDWPINNCHHTYILAEVFDENLFEHHVKHINGSMSSRAHKDAFYVFQHLDPNPTDHRNLSSREAWAIAGSPAKEIAAPVSARSAVIAEVAAKIAELEAKISKNL